MKVPPLRDEGGGGAYATWCVDATIIRSSPHVAECIRRGCLLCAPMSPDGRIAHGRILAKSAPSLCSVTLTSTADARGVRTAAAHHTARAACAACALVARVGGRERGMA